MTRRRRLRRPALAASITGAASVDRAIGWLGERYFSVDRRVLGVLRIAMGLLLLVDVLRRLPFAAMFYSEAGVWPAALARERPPGDPVWSLFFWLDTPAAAQAGMLVAAAIYLAYLLGYRTKLAQILAFVAFASLNARNTLVENRGHVEMNLALMWTLFLPLGDRYSLDARAAGERREAGPAVSLAVFAITLQIAAIYAFNALQKGGVAWESGQAIHYVLWQNRAVTGFGAWLREHMPAWFSPAFTTATLWAEGFCAAAALTPVAQRWARTSLLVVALGLHLGIAATINVWPHSFIILALDLLLLPPAWLDRLDPPSKLQHRFTSTPPAEVMLREAAAMVMLVAVLFRIGHDNAKLPAALRPSDLGGLEPLIAWPRLYQRWSMFAEVPLDDGTLVVDAVTAAGARIDPLTGAPPDLDAPLHGPWFQSQLQCDYYLKIQRADHVAYLPALVAYLTRWQELEARPADDRLVSFQVFWISAQSPAPGEQRPKRIRRRLLAQHP
jgi:hypothetical protein